MRKEHRPFAVSAVLALGVAVFLTTILGRTSRTYGIPAFARKYQTSCSTCHSNYPELNDFGEAFKKNGFKFPKDDETFVKEPPVMLGAKAQREVFPKAIYPGEMPGSIPIGFRYSGVEKSMTFAPRDGTWFWSNGSAWGTCRIVREGPGALPAAELTALHGALELKTFALEGAGKKNFRTPLRLTAGETARIEIR